MSRDLRFLPPDGALVEVTTRCFQRRFLLRPSRHLSSILIGALARLSERYDIGVVDHCFLSNHFHLLLVAPDALRLANFMRDFNSKIGKEVKRLHNWPEKIFGRRYVAIVVSDEPEAQEKRLLYLLRQGVKEGLVSSPKSWPGASGTASLLSGKSEKGKWFDRSAEYRANQRSKKPGRYAHATDYELTLVPLPCWLSLSPEERCSRVREMVSEIEEEAQARARDTGRSVLGRRAVLHQDPHSAPSGLESGQSPAPRFHAATRQARRALERAYSAFLDAYRSAADAFKDGNLDQALFPPGSFPPPLPFVRFKPG